MFRNNVSMREGPALLLHSLQTSREASSYSDTLSCKTESGVSMLMLKLHMLPANKLFEQAWSFKFFNIRMVIAKINDCLNYVLEHLKSRSLVR